ncbi:M56 family metallopeptidase [Tautonia sp. JC769]|uniref:M56 family metallopeptidase n=1 Tax=Tautonia sp. JC769 TaxID=3232135 RepID=UPI00345820E2
MARRFLEAISDAVPALVLADAAAKATLLLALAAIAALALGRASAAVRHRVWGLSLLGLAVLVPLSWVVPGGRFPIVPPAVAEFLTDRTPEVGNIGRDDRDASPRVAAPGGALPDPVDANFSGTTPDPGDAPADPTRPAPPDDPRDRPDPARRAIAGLGLIWSMGFLASVLYAVMGIIGNARRRRGSPEVVDRDWIALLGGLARELGIRRRVELRSSSSWPIPVTWGVVRPVILLPRSGLGWPEAARRAVLLHELAHIARSDAAFLTVGRLATAAFWFHPMAWYALHRLRVECEQASDDLVVRAGVRPTDYSRQLVGLARSLRGAGPALAVPMARTTSLEHRIMALFDERRSHRPLDPRSASALLCGAIVVMAGLAACRLGPSASGQQADPDPRPPAPIETAPSPTPDLVPEPTPDEDEPGPETHPITVSGRALDPDGRPIAGAEIFMASRLAAYRRIAETTTDADGRYEFLDVPLPIERADPNRLGGRDTGAFQVFGQAEGLGFAWRPVKWFFPKPSKIAYVPDMIDPPSRFEAGEPIVLDLNFPPAAAFSGRVVDDRGDPVPDARLEIRGCENLVPINNVVRGWSFDTLNERDSAPASMKIRTTDADGRFAFTGLPEGFLFRIDLRAEGFPSRWIYAATTADPVPDEDGAPVLIGEVELVLETPLDVPIVAVYGDTGEPAPRVMVSVAGGFVNTFQTSDEEGRVTLRVPPGDYRLSLLPERGTDYLVTEGRLDVGATPPAEPIVEPLRPAAILEVTVVDAETGEGLPDVDLWHQPGERSSRQGYYFRSWEVATRIAHVDRPRTDAGGTLRALVEPGKHRFGIAHDFSPRFYVPNEPRGEEVECRAGETVRLEFSMRKAR